MNILLIVLVFLSLTSASFAQHEHHMPDTIAPKKADTIPKAHDHHDMHDMSSSKEMIEMPSHSFSRNIPMSRNASGTAWNPDDTPMYMWMKQNKKNDWMFHGNLFVRYINTDLFNSGNRGNERLSAPNWFMAMMNHKTGKKGLINFTLMMSLDAWTEGHGYPLLFQTGESASGKRLVDQQHPHDLFSALSLGYTYSINKKVDIFGYFGYPGEPALGAPAFMHRISALNDPDAPLGHHWQDATHITWGVGTIGFRYSKFKLEGSIFTGREPDKHRYDFDKPLFDSYSYRISFNPDNHWALQFSQGFIKSPEILEPGVNVNRTSASALYTKKMGPEKYFSGAFIWGANNRRISGTDHSILLEGNYQCKKNAFFGRYEFVQKSAEELDLEGLFGEKVFHAKVLSAGMNRHLFNKKSLELLVGSKFTFNFTARDLKQLYGSLPIGFQIYLQMRPAIHQHMH